MSLLKTIVILAVEDEFTDQILITRAVENMRNDIKVVTVETGTEALDYVFRRGKFESRSPSTDPDIVLLDHSLPDMTGLDVLKSIRDNPDSHRLEVVVLSARFVDEDRDQYKLYRVAVFLQKPVDPD